MFKCKSVLIATFILFVSSSFLKAQETVVPDFEFEYQWDTYGHYKVSSKENKVYIKVQHPDVYADTAIAFTKEDKAKIWNKLIEIDFFNYPDDYSGCKFEVEKEQEFIVDYDYIEDVETGLFIIDSTSADTIWELAPLYFCEETTIPYGEYAISIYLDKREKLIEWNGSIEIYTIEEGKHVSIENPMYDKLFELGSLIQEITGSKQGYKNLPESNLEYY